MRYGTIPGLDRAVSRIVLGTAALSEGKADVAAELIDTYIAAGGNMIDTAATYGGGWSDRNVGAWLKRTGRRDDVLILGKGAHHDRLGDRVTPEEISLDLGLSLERLGTTYIDLLVLHRDDPKLSVGPIVEVLDHHHRRGRVRAVGSSNWSSARLAEARAYAHVHDLLPFTASSVNLALAIPMEPMWANCISIAGDEAGQAWYREQGIPVLSWSSQAGGFFSGRFSPEDRSNADMVRVYYNDANWGRFDRATRLGRDLGLNATQVALAWVLNQPGLEAFALVGPTTTTELEQSLAVADIVLTPAQVDWLTHGDR
jgi:aryl-alcohol dehydrogenase-like predicted oxidoreductase